MAIKPIQKINNLFNEEELNFIYKSLNESENHDDDKSLGRLKIQLNTLPPSIENKLCDVAYKLFGMKLSFSNATYVEYSSKYGEPNLPPHFDHDDKNLVFDYQLESNVSWGLGVNKKVIPLENNSSLLFNANEHIHWRPHKKFKDGEYVKMIFFRLQDKDSIPDYRYLDYSMSDPIFDEINKYRDSLRYEEMKLL